MRISLYLALAVAAAGVAPANAAFENLPPVGCILARTERQPRANLIELVKARFAPTTASGKTTMTMIGQVVQGCRRTHGWSKPREDAAVQYFAMHMLHEDAIEQGKRFGLTEPVVSGYVATLTPEASASYGAGKVTPELNRAAFAHLEKSGVQVATMKTEEIQALGQAFNMAIYTSLGQANAEKAYAGK
jgi:hypothetical protein